MKKLIHMLIVLVTVDCFSQAITVNTNTYSVPQLVNTVLINSPCVSATNITWKTGTNYSSSNGIGFFQNTNPNFPMQSGVILSTGNVSNASGPNSSLLNDGAANWPGDTSLESTLLQSGISMNSVNATILEFDFTPISSAFSFDFLFASEEYGNFQCQFSDAFAFLLTNTITGETTNLAVVPNTTTPISVVTIRDFLYNSSCPSANSQYFGSYNGGSAASSAAINFNGQTKMMNAAATLFPNVPYHIKLVIADRTDSNSDSSIFISSDTFNIGQDVLGQDINANNNNSLCFGDTHVLTSGLNPINYTFSWTKDGNTIAGETGPDLTINGSGVYGLTYQKTINGCVPVTDYVTVEYLPEVITQNPVNLYKCDTGSSTYTFDLSYNTPIVKSGLNSGTVVTYHNSLPNANAGINVLPNNYTAAPGTTVFVRIKNYNNDCYIVKSFDLLTTPAPVANQPGNITKCSASTFNNSFFDLSVQTNSILNGQSNSIYKVLYYSSLANANSGTNPITSLYANNNTTIYARLENIFDSSCFSITNFVLYVTTLPTVDTMESVVQCENYTLPTLVNGNYFTGPNGTGTALFAGDIIDETKTIYIFNQPNGPNGCSASSNFQVTILDPDTIAPIGGTFCGSFTLPPLLYGKYYTGDNATGTELQAGTVIITSQRVYVYFESLVTPFCIINAGFNLTILNTVDVGAHENVFDCSSYTLPTLPNGKYFTETDGGGTEILAGTVITSSQTVFVYAQSTDGCESQESFEVVIGLTVPADVSQCQPYTLPELVVGNYYTGPQGSGQQIAAGTSLNLTQTVYLYVATSGSSNCTDNLHFNIVVSQPIIDTLSDVTACGSYTLPTLTSGEYYTGVNGTGTMLHAGDVIITSQLIYIYKLSSTANCSNQSSFQITVNTKPYIDSRADIDVCNSYELTTLTNGNYFTGPSGTGTMLPAGTIITTSQLIYIYAVSPQFPDCFAENSFNITVYSVQADAPTNVVACDSYTLPALVNGNYYLNPNGPNGGEGSLLHAGDVISSSKTIYVYNESGERINCTDENSFTITINQTPVIAPIANVNACNSYVLPQLTVGDYYTDPNGTGTLLHENDVITTNQTIYVYAQTGTIPNCFDEKSFTVTLFNVDELADVSICENYTLPVLTVGKYYTGPNGTGTQINAGQVINTSQTLYIYKASTFSPVCYDESSFVITIVDTPIVYPVGINQRTTCDNDGTNDGVTDFDLSTLNSTILGNQTSTEFVVTYYLTQAEAVAGTNAILATTAQTFYAKVMNTLTASCYDIKSFTLKVNKLPEPNPVGGIMCYDSKNNILLNPYTISSGLSSSTHTFQWYNEAGTIVGSNSSYQVVVPGVYTVIATNSATGCSSDPKAVEVLSSEPAIVSYTLTDDFADNQIIIVEAVGVGGDYEYQLDFGPFQDSPTFENVSSGNHTITVRDKNGCGNSVSEALIINYPKFFTPNNDGYNDSWNIVDLKTKSNTIIYIYDRYGKLMSQVTPTNQGWDGRFAGQDMPSSDYWFTVSYEDEVGNKKEFKSHFAMKR